MNTLCLLPDFAALTAPRPVLATASGLSSSLDVVVIPFLFVLCAMTILYIRNYMTRKMQYETIRLMVEKGLPVSPEHFIPRAEPPKRRDDRRSGILWIAVAVGMFASFTAITANSPDISVGNQYMQHPTYGMTNVCVGTLNFACYRETRWIALIPGAVGVALLLCSWLDRRKGGDESTDGTKA